MQYFIFIRKKYAYMTYFFVFYNPLIHIGKKSLIFFVKTLAYVKN